VQQFPRIYWGLWRKAPAVIVGAYIAQEPNAARLAPPFANGTGSFTTQGKLPAFINSPAAIVNWWGYSIRQNKIARLFQQFAASVGHKLRQASVVMCLRWGSR